MPGDGVDLMTGTSEVLDYPTRIRRVSVADSKVADIQVINPYELNLVAHQPGFTTLAVWDTQGRYSEREIKVDESGKQQVLINVIVAELNRSRVENFGINWSMALPRWNISLVNMAGGVATPYNATASSHRQLADFLESSGDRLHQRGGHFAPERHSDSIVAVAEPDLRPGRRQRKYPDPEFLSVPGRKQYG